MGYIYGQLSQNESLEIYSFVQQGLSNREIGRRLSRAASTISREIVRAPQEVLLGCNRHVRRQWAGGYCPVRAHKLTKLRRVMDKSRFKLVASPLFNTLSETTLRWVGRHNSYLAGCRVCKLAFPSAMSQSIATFIIAMNRKTICSGYCHKPVAGAVNAGQNYRFAPVFLPVSLSQSAPPMWAPAKKLGIGRLI